jgi:transposase
VTLTMADMANLPGRQDGTVGSGDGLRSGHPKRRAFTAEYKMQILQQYGELADDPQARSMLLRREGIHTSHISEWCKARDESAENGQAGKPARAAAAAAAALR